MLLFYPVLDDDFTAPSYKTYGAETELNIPMMQYFWNNYAPAINRNKNTLCPQKNFNPNNLDKLIIISAKKDALFSEAQTLIKKLTKASIPVKHIIIKNTKGFMTYGQGHLPYAI